MQIDRDIIGSLYDKNSTEKYVSPKTAIRNKYGEKLPINGQYYYKWNIVRFDIDGLTYNPSDIDLEIEDTQDAKLYCSLMGARKDYCLATYSEKLNDLSFCAGMDNIKKQCLHDYIDSSVIDIEFCNDLNGSGRRLCLYQLAKQSNDISICNEINGDVGKSSFFDKYDCITIFAGDDSSICQSEDEIYNFNCLFSAFEIGINLTLTYTTVDDVRTHCAKLDNQEDDCLEFYATRLEKPELCKDFTDKSKSCYKEYFTELAIESLDVDICLNLQDVGRSPSLNPQYICREKVYDALGS